MTDTFLLILGLFLFIPATVAWAIAIVGLWSWYRERDADVVENYAAMVNRHAPPQPRFKGDCEIVSLKRGPRA